MRRAIILAGGMGTRLRPYTVVLPKPLMPIGDYPILEIIIRQLRHAGFSHITMAVNHQADLIKAFFGDGSQWGLKIDYSLEDKPLSTMGPLKLIEDLPENFLVMNGDILTDLDYAKFHDDHIRSGKIFTISAKRRQHKVEYGVLDTKDGETLSGFREKPVSDYLVSMGIYMISRDALKDIPRAVPYGFDHLMHALLKEEIPVALREFAGYWLDIGRPDDYMQAIDEFASMRETFIRD